MWWKKLKATIEVLDNNKPFKKIFRKVLSGKITPLEHPLLFVNILFSPEKSSDGIYPGIEHIIELRSRGNKSPVVFYGFDRENRLRKRKKASVLNSEGVFYLYMPFNLSELFKVISDAIKCERIEVPLDETTETEKILNDLGILSHNLKPNFLGTIKPNINGLKNAKKQKIKSEWSIAKEAVIKAGRDHIQKQIKFYNGIRELKRKRNVDIHEKLLEMDRCYKRLFDILSSNRICQENIVSVIENGEKITDFIEDVYNMLEEVKIEFRKI